MPHRRILFLAAIVVAVITANYPIGVSADEFAAIKPEELAMTSLPEAPGAPAVILYRQVDREDKLYASNEHVYYRLKIFTEAGRAFGNVEIPMWHDWFETSSVRGRTVHADGTVVPFDGKVYQKTIYKAKGAEYTAKVFTLPDVQVGSVIEYSYNLNYRDNYFFEADWLLSEPLFTKEAKFSIKTYTEHGLAIHWNIPAGLPEGTKPPEPQAGGIVRMEARNIPAFQTEDYMPPASELKYRVVFLYSFGLPEDDPDKFWRSFGKKKYGEIDSFLGKRSVLEKIVAETVAPGDSPDVKLHKLYSRAQKIRDLSYELRKTEEEKKHDDIKPIKDLEDVLKYGYGFKDQIDWLFMGLARAAGFEASPVLAGNRKYYFFKKERMNSRELELQAVAVKIDGREIYLDPGGFLAPYGLLPWEQTGVPGLRLDKSGPTWIETDLGKSSDSEVRRVADLKLDEDGTLEGKLEVTFSGQEVYALRIDEHLKDDVARKKFLEDKIKEYVASGTEVDLTSKPDFASSSPSLTAEFNIKVPGWASITSKRAIMPVGLFGNPEKHTFEHAKRFYPVYFEHPFLKTDEITIKLPAAWHVASLPRPKTLDLKAAKYDMTTTAKDKTIQIKREMKIEFVLMDQKFYAPLRAFFQALKTEDEQQIVLDTTAAPTAAAESR